MTDVLAIVKYLTTSPESQLPNVRTSPRGQTTVYFSLLGKLFILLPPKAFRTISLAISAFANFQLSSIVR